MEGSPIGVGVVGFVVVNGHLGTVGCGCRIDHGGCLKLPTKIEFFYLSPRSVKDDKLMSEFNPDLFFARVGFSRSFRSP
jgi:hypothetical protein